jgi:hypothetical protein
LQSSDESLNGFKEALTLKTVLIPDERLVAKKKHMRNVKYIKSLTRSRCSPPKLSLQFSAPAVTDEMGALRTEVGVPTRTKMKPKRTYYIPHVQNLQQIILISLLLKSYSCA